MKNDEYLFIDDLFFLQGLLESRIAETKERLSRELDQAVPNRYLIDVFANDLEYFSVLHDKLDRKNLAILTNRKCLPKYPSIPF